MGHQRIGLRSGSIVRRRARHPRAEPGGDGIATSPDVPYSTGLFPDRLPIGVETSQRVVFLYLVTRPIEDDFRAFLQRHGDLLRALPGWTLRLLVQPHAATARTGFEEAAREELTVCFRPAVIDNLMWYFRERQLPPEDRLSLSDLEHFWTAREAFDTPRCRVLYRRWLADSDTALDVVSSPAIAEALARGTGRIESQVLEVPYRHLSPLVNHVRSSSTGVEEGEERGEPTSARSQPPFPRFVGRSTRLAVGVSFSAIAHKSH
jgi:hypothetical protein